MILGLALMGSIPIWLVFSISIYSNDKKEIWDIAGKVLIAILFTALLVTGFHGLEEAGILK